MTFSNQGYIELFDIGYPMCKRLGKNLRKVK